MDTRSRLEAALAGHYRIERQLGEGGMARVYLAEDLKHKRSVAIKVLRSDLSAVMGSERFLREIEVVARLNHPNILGLHDSGEADGLLYFVMPFVEGKSLRARLEREGRLPLDEAVRITREVGDALQYAHEKGLVHRDIKPENILFQAGHALVCDFGIAQATSQSRDRLTRTGIAVGTFTYMSPEQLTDGGTVDQRTDVYALGCMLHEMLSGEAAFPAATPQMALVKKLSGTAPDLATLRSDVPRTVTAVLERALAVEPEDRYPTAGVLVRSLGEAVTTMAIEKDPLPRPRLRGLRVVAGGAGVLLVGAIVWWLSQMVERPVVERVAVLPLSNRANDPSLDYLVQGAHGALVLEMAKAGLRVINPTSVAQYAGTTRPAREIAAELQVDGIVQGAAGMAGDRLAVDLQLVHGQSEEILWAESFEASLQDVVTLYRRATLDLAQQMGVRLGQETLARLAVVQTVDPQVYRALLQARFHRERLTEEGFATALDYFQLALQRDSLSAEAWAGIAQIWSNRVVMGLVPDSVARPLNQAALARAAAIDPSLSQVQALVAGQRVWVEWDWRAGEEAYVRALEADPTDSPSRAYFAHLLLYLGRDAEALEELERAAELDPFNTLAQALCAMGLNALHRYEEAEATLLRMLERDPQAPMVLSTLRTTYHLMGRHEEAMEMWRASYERARDTEAVEALEAGYRAGGYSAALRAVAELFVERSATTFVTPWQIATLYTRAGMVEPALDYLERAFEARDPNMPYISIDPIFDPLRREPRFRALMDRLGLPQ
jgi:eukaryotic-like serine/threonine-protein kinase